jgi:hypothetical protein
MLNNDRWMEIMEKNAWETNLYLLNLEIKTEQVVSQLLC